MRASETSGSTCAQCASVRSHVQGLRIREEVDPDHTPDFADRFLPRVVEEQRRGAVCARSDAVRNRYCRLLRRGADPASREGLHDLGLDLDCAVVPLDERDERSGRQSHPLAHRPGNQDAAELVDLGGYERRAVLPKSTRACQAGDACSSHIFQAEQLCRGHQRSNGFALRRSVDGKVEPVEGHDGCALRLRKSDEASVGNAGSVRVAPQDRLGFFAPARKYADAEQSEQIQDSRRTAFATPHEKPGFRHGGFARDGAAVKRIDRACAPIVWRLL